eukprot:403332100
MNESSPSIAQERDSFLFRESLQPRLNGNNDNYKSQISSFSNQSLSSLEENDHSSNDAMSNSATIFAMSNGNNTATNRQQKNMLSKQNSQVYAPQFSVRSSQNMEQQLSQFQPRLSMGKQDSKTTEIKSQILDSNEVDFDYEKFTQVNINGQDMIRQKEPPKTSQNSQANKPSQIAHTLLIDMTRKPGTKPQRSMQQYNVLIDQEIKKLNQMKRDKQTTPILAPSQCGLLEDRSRQNTINNPMNNLTSQHTHSLSIRHESIDKKPQKNKITPRQGLASKQPSLGKKKKSNTKNINSSSLKQNTNQYRLMIDTFNNPTSQNNNQTANNLYEQQLFKNPLSTTNKQISNNINGQLKQNQTNLSTQSKNKQAVLDALMFMSKNHQNNNSKLGVNTNLSIQDPHLTILEQSMNEQSLISPQWPSNQNEKSEYFEVNTYRAQYKEARSNNKNQHMVSKPMIVKNAASFVNQGNPNEKNLSEKKFNSQQKNTKNLELVCASSLEFTMMKPTPKNLMVNFERSRQPDGILVENYSTQNQKSTDKRILSANRPLQTMKSYNQQKANDLNQSLKAHQLTQSPNFKLTRDLSIEGATVRSNNQMAAQVYNSSVVIKNGFERHSPTNVPQFQVDLDSLSSQVNQSNIQNNSRIINNFTINSVLNNIQTPTNNNHHSQRSLAQPKSTVIKSSSQSDLKGSGKKMEQPMKQRAQDVRELSVKKSLLAQDSNHRGSLKQTKTQNYAFNHVPASRQSPKGMQKRIGSFDVSSQNFVNYYKNKLAQNNPQLYQNPNHPIKVIDMQPHLYEYEKEYNQIANRPRDAQFIKDSQIPFNNIFIPDEHSNIEHVNNIIKQRSLTQKNPHNDGENQTIHSEVAEDGRNSVVEKANSASTKIDQNSTVDQDISQNGSNFFSRVKNLFRRNTSIQTTGQILNPIQIETNNQKDFQTAIDTLNNKDNRQLTNYGDIYSPIMNECSPNKEIMKDDLNSSLENMQNYSLLNSSAVNDKQGRQVYFKQNETQPIFSCNCPRLENVNYGCSRAMKWFQDLNRSREIDIGRMRSLYYSLIDCDELSTYEDQILKDLNRTFPKCPQFQEIQGQNQLKRVLLAFSKYDPKLGYVQGMNFIVGSMLYHCNEEIAFWMFVALIEEFELRDIFEPNLPGLYKHCYVLDKMIETHIKDLHTHFDLYSIEVQMYASDWIFCLFSNIIPLPLMADFYDEFFLHGWPYFYKFCLSMLDVFKDKLLKEDEFSGILSHIKFKTPEKNLTHNTYDPDIVIENGNNNSQQKQSPNQPLNKNNQSYDQQQIQNQKGSQNSHQKQEEPPIIKSRSLYYKFMNLIKANKEGIWQKIFTKSEYWKITEDNIKQLITEHQNKVKLSDLSTIQAETPPKRKITQNYRFVEKQLPYK